MQLLAVDPGLRGCGVAIFDEETKKLVRADYVKGSAKGERAEAWLAMGDAIDEWCGRSNGTTKALVIECPQVYQRAHMSARKRGTDPNDLIQLAAVVGVVTSCIKSVVEETVLLPMEWKGQVPKDVMWDRALKRLSPDELAVMPKFAKDVAHNMHDAIMLGLVHLGRLGRFSELPTGPISGAAPMT